MNYSFFPPGTYPVHKRAPLFLLLLLPSLNVIFLPSSALALSFLFMTKQAILKHISFISPCSDKCLNTDKQYLQFLISFHILRERNCIHSKTSLDNNVYSGSNFLLTLHFSTPCSLASPPPPLANTVTFWKQLLPSSPNNLIIIVDGHFSVLI